MGYKIGLHRFHRKLQKSVKTGQNRFKFVFQNLEEKIGRKSVQIFGKLVDNHDLSFGFFKNQTKSRLSLPPLAAVPTPGAPLVTAPAPGALLTVVPTPGTKLTVAAAPGSRMSSVICNTPCYDSTNYLLIIFIRGLTIHQMLWIIKL
jgi:hypothetical protein